MDPAIEISRSLKDISSSLRDIAKGMHALNDRLLETGERLKTLEDSINQEGDA